MTYTKEQKEFHVRFLQAWDSAVGAPRYQKDDWRDLDGDIHRALGNNQLRVADLIVQSAEQLAIKQGALKKDPDSHIKWKLSKEYVMEYHAWNRQIVKEYFLPNGHFKKAFVNKANDYVVGMVLTPENDIVLCREFRPGPEKIMLDLPAGALNKGEDPKDGMARELLEETGYAGDLEFVSTTLVNPYSIQRRHTFLVRNAKLVGPQQTDHDEFIEVVKMPLFQFINEWVMAGKTTNSAAAFFCLDKLGMMKLGVGDGKLQPMSAEQVMKVAVSAGILTPDGELTPDYK